MLRLIASRILSGIVTIVLVSVVVFAATELIPGNAAQVLLGQQANDPVLLHQVEKQLGLDQPLPVRYVKWATAFIHGDMGTASGTTEPVTTVIGHRLVNSAILGGITLLLLILLSVTVGTLAGIVRYSALDDGISFVTIVLGALPEFVIGVALVLIFGLVLHVLPAVTLFPPEDYAYQHPKDLILPVATLLSVSLGFVARLVRASVIETFDLEFIEMARLKGIPERQVILRHVIPNSMVSTIQISAIGIAGLLAGAVVVETVFQYPGVGIVITQAVTGRDITVIQAMTMIIAATYILGTVLADVLTILVTPRLRTSL